MRRQATRAERMAVADDLIDNDGPPEALNAQVAKLDALYRSLSDTSGNTSENAAHP